MLCRNFELPRVKSINASGHKYGLVYAGVGWIIWRDRSYLPKDLIFELHYLGGTEESYTLNFSRPGAQVIGQYYNLIHLGFNGYREIMENCLANARMLSKALERTGWFTCISGIHRKRAFKGVAETVFHKQGETSADYNPGLPVVSFRLSDQFKKDYPHVKQDSISILLRAKQYIIPSKCIACLSTSWKDNQELGTARADILITRLSAPAKGGEDGDPPRGHPRKHACRPGGQAHHGHRRCHREAYGFRPGGLVSAADRSHLDRADARTCQTCRGSET